MRAAFTYLLQTLNCDAAILVGSDIPLLTADHFDEARETLVDSDGVVLGPADDGGYYLIGMRRVYAELFEGVAWGTSSVLTDTLRVADRAGIEARLIRPAYDVDTIEDLRRLEDDLRYRVAGAGAARPRVVQGGIGRRGHGRMGGMRRRG